MLGIRAVLREDIPRARTREGKGGQKRRFPGPRAQC